MKICIGKLTLSGKFGKQKTIRTIYHYTKNSQKIIKEKLVSDDSPALFITIVWRRLTKGKIYARK